MPPARTDDFLSLQIIMQISDRTAEEKQLILQVIKDMLKFCELSKNHTSEKSDEL